MLVRLTLAMLLLSFCAVGGSQLRFGDDLRQETPVLRYEGPWVNPLRIAQGRWYEANRVGNLFGGTSALHFRHPTFFDGDHIWGFGFVEPDYGFVKMRVSDGNVTCPGYFELAGPMAFDGKYVWCHDSEGETSRICRIDAATGIPYDYFDDWPPGDCDGKWLAFDGEYMWTAAYTGPGDEIFKLSTGATISILGEGGAPVEPITMLLADGEYIWAAGERGVARIDRDDLSYDELYLETNRNCRVAFDGRYIWVSAHGDAEWDRDAVYVIDPDTLAVRKTFSYEEPEPGDIPDICQPGAMVFDGEDMWIVNNYPPEAAEYVTKINVWTYAVTGNVCRSSSSIIQLIFDGCNVWGIDPDAGGGYGGAWRY